MATNPTTPGERKIRQIEEQMNATFVTQAKLNEAAAERLIDAGYAQARNKLLINHRDDLDAEVLAISQGAPVTVAPSDMEIALLATAVVTLQQRNVTAASIHAIIADGFVLAGLVLREN